MREFCVDHPRIESGAARRWVVLQAVYLLCSLSSACKNNCSPVDGVL